MSQAVTIYFLEQQSPAELRPKPQPQGLHVRECRVKQWPFNRFLYEWIGGRWNWVDKLTWDEQRWRAYAEADTLRTWVGYVEGAPAGYYELEQQHDQRVEIKYFGLAPAFIGRGFGGYLLTHALQSAWDWGAGRVGVNTCSLDHAAALANYRARGMRLVRQEIQHV